uniref:ATP-dependent DNA helicase n=1 Tax=Lactuca sativa TaxID=4236 RepID=A0A9R1XJX3_LACSA|nr:hypothetical protein LSAT_V11C300146760 [Lactuca sativa]
MAKRQVVEAVDRTMQFIIDEKLPFGGKIMVMGDDFRQVLDVALEHKLWTLAYKCDLYGFQLKEIVVGQHAGKRVFLPRVPLSPFDDGMFPFKQKRKQFPIQLSFSMTINKAQGQTIPNIGVYLPESVFSYGQLYVVFSRGISRVNTNVLVKMEKNI